MDLEIPLDLPTDENWVAELILLADLLEKEQTRVYLSLSIECLVWTPVQSTTFLDSEHCYDYGLELKRQFTVRSRIVIGSTDA